MVLQSFGSWQLADFKAWSPRTSLVVTVRSGFRDVVSHMMKIENEALYVTSSDDSRCRVADDSRYVRVGLLHMIITGPLQSRQYFVATAQHIYYPSHDVC